MSSYGTDLQDKILQASQQDVRYMEIVHRLEQGAGTIICDGTCTGDDIGVGTGDGIGIGIGIGTCIGIGTGGSAHDVDYFLIVDGLV